MQEVLQKMLFAHNFQRKTNLEQWLECKDEAFMTQSLAGKENIACVQSSIDAHQDLDTESDDEEIQIIFAEGLALCYKYL